MAQINIAGTLHNTEEIQGDALNSHVVAHADEILDATKGKKQSEVNTDVDTALADRYTKEETYSKSQVDNLITTPNVQYVSVTATAQTTSVTDVLPATGAADTIYRVGFWDGSAFDDGKYSEYAWNGSAYQLLAVRSGSLDGVYDISANNLTEGQPTQYADLAAALGTNGANVPTGVRAGGMSVKFIIQLYTVAKTTSGTQPSGTLLNTDPGIAVGNTYKAADLSAFATLPTTDAVVYYVSDGEETPTYTIYTISKNAISGCAYVQYRLMSAVWSNVVTDWQGVDAEPTAGSKNLVESGGVYDCVHAISSKTLLEQGTQYKNVYVGSDTSEGQIGEIVTSISPNAYAVSIDLEPGDYAIILKGYIWLGDYGYAFFDKNDDVLTYGKYPIDGEQTLNVPTGATYVHLSLRSAQAYGRDVTIKSSSSLKDSVSALQDDVTILQDGVADIDNKIGEYSGEVQETITTEAIQYKNVYVGSDTSVGQVGEIINSTSQSSFAARVELPLGTLKVKIYARRWVGDFGCAFFDSNNILKGYTKYNTLIPAETLFQYLTIDVPDGSSYLNVSLGGDDKSLTLYSVKTIASTLNDLSGDIDSLSESVLQIEEEIDDISSTEFYNPLGSPAPYVSSLDTTGLSLFTTVSDLYAAWDALAAAHSDFLKKEADLGRDASNTYDIRHYTLRFQHPEVNTARDLTGENLWSDSTFKMRRVILNMATHGNEKPSVLGGYLAIKAILESSDNWAEFIKDNFIIDIVPCLNPYGFQNDTRDNSASVNINRDFNSSTPQDETAAMKSLISDLKPKGLVGIVDCHNCNYNGGGYLVAKSTYKYYHYYARMAQMLQSLLYSQLNTVFGSGDNHFHLWVSSDSGQLHEYADTQKLLGCTFEIANNAGVNGAPLTKSIAVNLLASFGAFIGIE